MFAFIPLARFALIPTAILAFGSLAHADPLPVMPSGTYTLDPRHTSVIFKISHLGFSHFTGRFDHVEGDYTYDAVNPTRSALDVTIYPNSVDTNDAELDDTLRGENWFDTLKYPRATFHTTKIEPTGDNTAKITGDFTLHDVTHTVILNTTSIGAGKEPFTGTPIMGFSAIGTFNRSDYGIDNLEPFVGDEVTLEIDTEFDKDK